MLATMMIFTSKTPGLAIHTYLIADESSKKCAVIDVPRHIEPILTLIKNQDLELTDILETHVHADFASGSLELRNACPTAKIHCSAMGGEEWTPHYADHHVKNGDIITIGETTLQAIHTPGHTPEHISWLGSFQGKTEALFTGDFLFCGAVGRPDLLGEEAKQQLASQLYESLFSTLDTLPDELPILPSHGAGSLCGKALASRESSTIGNEKKTNPFLKHMPKEKWISTLMQGMPQAPPYFTTMKKLNVTGAPLLKEDIPELTEIPPGIQLVDVRSMIDFCYKHIPGSINVSLEVGFATWAGWILDYDRPMILIGKSKEELEQALKECALIGLDQIAGTFLFEKWEEPSSDLYNISVFELRKSREKYLLIDVRSDAEWEGGFVEGAVRFPFGTKDLPTFDKEAQIAVVCGGGIRSQMVASYLQSLGYRDISNVEGGMADWRRQGFPTSSSRDVSLNH